MKSKLIVLAFFISGAMISCSSLNEFGQRRNKFSIEKIKPNTNEEVYALIDTAQLYQLVSIESSFGPVTIEKVKNNPSYLKFYSNGRVGEFENIDFNNVETLNPKRAKSHLYRLKKGKLILQSYFKNPQCGECFVKQTIVKNTDSQIFILSENYKKIYVKVEIPKAYLKYQPDW
ncbi:MAG TPA: hypothetical protein VL022_06000 [Moheibacter sp.]|nr:hypothetical protein [Moheibacter sp.]